MRRRDREVTDRFQINKILTDCKTCHLAMVEDGLPYVIPLSYGYELEDAVLTLFFHSAKEGRKLDILHKNSAVCFAMCIEGEPVFKEKNPCNSGYCFSSVHGFGNVQFVEDSEEKGKALAFLMKQQANISTHFTQKQTENVCVFKVISTDFTAKRKYK